MLKWQNQAPIKLEAGLGKEEGEVVQNRYLFWFSLFVLLFKERTTNLQMCLEYILRITQLIYFAREK